MRIYLDCIPCFMQQALRAGRMATSNEKKLKQILDETGETVKTISMFATPAEIGMSVYRIVSEVTGVHDPYKKIKQQHLTETKCPIISKHLGVEDGSIILKEHK